MKKMLLCLACMLLVCASAVAQNRQGGRNRQGNPQRGFNPVAVIDTAVINRIGLSEDLLARVYNLKEKQDAVAQEQMAGMMPERGKKMDKGAREEMTKKTQALKDKFRKDLRELIGDESYILYLEKSLDNRGMMRNMQMGAMQRGNMGGQQGGFPGGGPEGGFPGGGFDGGF